MNINTQIHMYDEKMLRLQFEASEIFTHSLTKGEVREDFIKRYVKSKINNIRLEKGCIYKDDIQSSQLDLILCDNNSQVNQYGEHSIIAAEFCKLVFEIKSVLNNSYLIELSEVANKLKGMNENIKVGMLGYKLDVQEKTILKRFGYIYDKNIDTYDYNKEKIDESVKNIDYIISLDEESEFLLTRDKEDYILIKEIPIIKYFWDAFKSS